MIADSDCSVSTAPRTELAYSYFVGPFVGWRSFFGRHDGQHVVGGHNCQHAEQLGASPRSVRPEGRHGERPETFTERNDPFTEVQDHSSDESVAKLFLEQTQVFDIRTRHSR